MLFYFVVVDVKLLCVCFDYVVYLWVVYDVGLDCVYVDVEWFEFDCEVFYEIDYCLFGGCIWCVECVVELVGD